ncbi:MAG: hypothetical protein P8L89_09565, partial [Polaribacter sp.]|nr:hypothetical protein [Polaribacter sp.]
MENYTVNEGKTAAIISYFWVVGLIIAFIMNTSKKNSFTSFHIRQMIGLSIASVLNGILHSFNINSFFTPLILEYIFFFFLMAPIRPITHKIKRIKPTKAPAVAPKNS